MSEIIRNIVVCCSECHASGVPFVHGYIWYHNQHGVKVRVFCHVCGCVTDKTEKKGIVSTELKPWKAEITRPVEGDVKCPQCGTWQSNRYDCFRCGFEFGFST